MAMISMLLLRNTYTCYYRDTIACLLYGAIGKATAHHLMHCYVVAGLFDICVDTSIIQTIPECRTD